MAKFTVPTKVLSTRIPEPCYLEIQNMVERRQISVSDWVQEMCGNSVDLKQYTKKKAVSNEDIDALEMITPVLAGAGIGTGVYFLVKHYFKENYPDKNAEIIAILSAMAIGIGSTFLVNSMTGLGGKKSK
jgi:hypothetical protein